MTELSEPGAHGHTATLTVDDLSRLFEGDSIRDNSSNQTLEKWGKY
jgi:hypothetical protein